LRGKSDPLDPESIPDYDQEDDDDDERPDDERPREEPFDTGGDGYDDRLEVNFGSDPLDPESVPERIPGRREFSMECGIVERREVNGETYTMIFVDGMTIELLQMEEDIIKWILDADFEEGEVVFFFFDDDTINITDDDFSLDMDDKEIERSTLDEVLDATGDEPLYTVIKDRRALVVYIRRNPLRNS
jgi:hypothetical protein